MKTLSITHHAQKRVVERFKLFMYPSEIRNPKQFLEREFKHAYRDITISMHPFYARQVQEKYGITAFYAHSPNITFACIEEGDVIVVKTIFKRKPNWKPI